MSAKKWVISFIITVLVLTFIVGGFNYFSDPFGAFGDKILDWFAYDETNNPRVAKTEWIKEHFDEYDSYIVGCSSTSGLSAEDFNEIYGGSFYNLFTYGADMLDVEQQVSWLFKNDEVKHIVLNVYIDYGQYYGVEDDKYTQSMHAEVDGSSMLDFYSTYLFANPQYGVTKLIEKVNDTVMPNGCKVFNISNGSYDKRERDVENIGSLEKYLTDYQIFTQYPRTNCMLTSTDLCVEGVRSIRQMCEEHGCEFTVVSAPIYKDYITYFTREDIEYFYTKLANVTDFWDFSYTSVSFEPRYFYDATHFRNCIGHMMADRIACRTNSYIPDDFGTLVTADNLAEHLSTYWDATEKTENELAANVPILLYHSVIPDGTVKSDTEISVSNFEMHLATLQENGYTVISLDRLREYVYKGTDLPEKPVIITFDDGYLNNYEYAYPILQKYNAPATIFTIGYSFGKDTYKDTGVAITPHFNAEQASEMLLSGLIDIQSHSYDMHQVSAFGESEKREIIQPYEGESVDDFYYAVCDDFTKSKQLLEPITNKSVTALSYPHGIFSKESEIALVATGADMTFGIIDADNIIMKGVPQTMLGLNRYSVNDTTTAQLLLNNVLNAHG